MAYDTINSIDGYITRVRGTATTFVRATAINGVKTLLTAKDFVDFEAAKAAGASVAGTQTIDCGGLAVAGEDAGLLTQTYTASINLDGTVYPISIDATAADTFTTILGLVNADLPGTELSIVGGNLVVTSPTTGNASYVVIADVDLFSSLTTYVGTLDPVDGGTGEALKDQTLDNGANAWEAYKTAREVYDTAADATVIQTKYAVADLNAVFSDTEVEAELAALKVKVDALQDLVLKLLN